MSLDGATYNKGSDIPFEATITAPSDDVILTDLIVSFVAKTRSNVTIATLSTVNSTLTRSTNTAAEVVVAGIIPRSATSPTGRYVPIDYAFTIETTSGIRWKLADYEGTFYLKDELFNIPEDV